MKKILNCLLTVAFLVPFSFAQGNSDYYEDSYARMSYVNGDVFIQRAEDLGYEEGVVNLVLIQGDKIGAREGRTELHLGDGNYIRIDRHTQIEMVKMPDRTQDVTGVHLLSGSLFLRINFIEDNQLVEVHTPDASVYVLEEGLYYLSTLQSNPTEVKVFEGSAEVAGEEGSLLLEAEEKLLVSNGRFVSQPTYFYPSMDSSFAEWNRSRDAYYSRYVAGTHYLPEGMREYEAELAYAGDWRYHNRYGYVWIPQRISISWRPYLNGRWVWYPIIGWTWISYDPWGWCVFHYGRWHWSVSLGWYWIPTRRWGPAWVHWYHGPDYIGWGPLSYYGYPGVIINNHYYGNYYYNDYPSNSEALVVVRKDQLQARNISEVALSSLRVSRLSDIKMSSAQPKIQPALNKSYVRSQEAAKVFSSARSREVSKVYSAERALKSTPRFGDLNGNRSLEDKKVTNSPRSSDISKTITSYPSRNAQKNSDSFRKTLSASPSSNRRFSKPEGSSDSSRLRQNEAIKRYPSRTSSSNVRLNSSRNIDSSKRNSRLSSGSRNISSSSSTRSSVNNRFSATRDNNRATTRVNRSTTSRRELSSSRTSTLSRLRSSSSRISNQSTLRNSSSRRMSSQPTVRSSSSQISSRTKARSSSTRISSARSSSSSRVSKSSSAGSQRSSRSSSSSQRSSTKRSKKK